MPGTEKDDDANLRDVLQRCVIEGDKLASYITAVTAAMRERCAGVPPNGAVRYSAANLIELARMFDIWAEIVDEMTVAAQQDLEDMDEQGQGDP